MSELKKITLTQFRNFNSGSFSFDQNVVGITGKNGTGKTNLLDAVYYLCYTKSYFQSKEHNNAQHGTEGFRIEGTFTEEQISCKWKEGKKTISCDNIPYEKVTDHIGKHTAVMVAPDDIELINGGSELRRKFMDGLLAQSNNQYLEHLLHYQKYLQQRNAHLKQSSTHAIDHNLLDIYDEKLAEHGAFLITARTVLSHQIPELVQQYYSGICNGTEQINIRYKNCCTADRLLHLLQQNRRYDMDYKRTIAGVHTEDWILEMNNISAKAQASQGQKKSLLISLKLAQLALMQNLQQKPFLLLDDIFEKLDQHRLKQLFELLKSFDIAQIFMTHTYKQDLESIIHPFYNQTQYITLS